MALCKVIHRALRFSLTIRQLRIYRSYNQLDLWFTEEKTDAPILINLLKLSNIPKPTSLVVETALPPNCETFIRSPGDSSRELPLKALQIEVMGKMPKHSDDVVK